MLLPKTSTTKGTLLVEICIALGIFLLIISATLVTATAIQNGTENTTIKRQALYTAKNNIERALFIFEASKTMSTTTSYSFYSPCRITFTSKIEMNTKPATSSLSLSVLEIDPQEDKNLGLDCHGSPFQTQNTPALYTYDANVKVTDIDVFKNTIYVSALAQSSTTPSFYINNAPVLFGFQVKALDVIKNFAFLALDSTSTQIKIVDISRAGNVVANVKLPNVTGSFPGGTSVFYYNKKLYVGTHRTAGNEFHVFNVADPSHPQWLGSIELNHNINDIYVKNNYAYLATSGNTKNIIIIDISDPTHLKEISSLAFSGNEDALKVEVLGNYLFAGRINTVTKEHPEFEILDISDPIHPVIVQELLLHDAVADFQISGTIAYIALSHSKLLKYDISDISKPILKETISLPDIPVSLDFENNFLYIGLQHSVMTKLYEY